jgi:hypothetical protein
MHSCINDTRRTLIAICCQEELDRKAAEDPRLAQDGMVKLKVGEEIHYKHIDELTREDRPARIAAETEEVDWLMERLRLRKEQS